MSSKKDKFLESAQKFILKGQLDRAIKDYEQVVALDPNDIRHRQRLAELLVRANRKEDAIAEYEAIGRYYADNGYYLKAIAVYKQVQKLDPGDIKISLNLAALNEKQGLTGNALAEYSRVYGHYDKSGKSADALLILDKMIAIDPENLNTRLKLAETRLAAGDKDKAYGDFVQLAFQLRERGDEGAFNQLCDRVRYLFPAKREFVLELATVQLKSGDAASAIPGLREVTLKDRDNMKAWRLLADALRTTGDREGLKSVFQEMTSLFPAELSPWEGLIQCALDDGDTEGALFLLNLHGPQFLEKGAYKSLELPYLSLLERTPEDARLLQGLKSLYQASGQQTKLAGVVERLDLLGGENPEPGAGPQENGTPPDEGVSVAAAHPAEPGQEAEWAEELDFPSSADGSVELAGSPAEAFSEPPADRPFVDAALPEDSAGLTEVDLELDLTDDELVDLAELYHQAGADELPSYDLPEEETDGSAAEGPPFAESGPLPCEVDLPEELEYIELETEIFAELEVEEAASAAEHDKYSLDGLFSAFKKELGQHLDEEDTETHYSLGIAFKEMGLYDDAIAEFQAASLDPRRKVDCITLQGVCCRDKGDFARAEEILREGIALKGVAAEELSPLKYELALLYDTTGRKEDALLLYHEINGVNSGFRDTAEKIAGVHGGEQDYYDLDLVELDGEEE